MINENLTSEVLVRIETGLKKFENDVKKLMKPKAIELFLIDFKAFEKMYLSWLVQVDESYLEQLKTLPSEDISIVVAESFKGYVIKTR